jgi:hypothetical protein
VIVDEGAADRLVAETIGLLFEPLGIDEVLTGANMLKVLADVRALTSVDSEAVVKLGTDIRAVLGACEAEVRLSHTILKAAPFSRSDTGPMVVESALRIVRNGGATEVLEGMAGLPVEAFGARLGDIKKMRARLKRVLVTQVRDVLGQEDGTGRVVGSDLLV